MNRVLIGSLFIICGLAYGSAAIDAVYSRTLGWLVANRWIKEYPVRKTEKTALGRKPTIFLYSIALIIIGIFILWNRNN